MFGPWAKREKATDTISNFMSCNFFTNFYLLLHLCQSFYLKTFFSPLSIWTNYLNKVTFVCQTFTECHSFLLGPARLVHPVLFTTWWVHPLIHKPTARTSILKGTQVSHPVFWLIVSSTTNTYIQSNIYHTDLELLWIQYVWLTVISKCHILHIKDNSLLSSNFFI